MKIVKYISTAFLTLAALSACTTDLKEAYLNDQADIVPARLQELSAPVIIDENNMGDELTFEWTRADYGFSSGEEYTIYARIGEDSTRVTSAFGNSVTVTYRDINRAALAINAEANERNDVSIYLVSMLTSSAQPIKSNVITAVIQPFRIPYPDFIYIPGNHQGWSPATAPTLSPNTPNNEGGQYEGFANLTTTESQLYFKFTGQPDWAPDNWGGTLASLVLGSNDNISELSNGYYYLRLNLPGLRAEAIAVTRVGIIGDGVAATGWDGDVEFTMDPTNNQIWTITGLAMTGGEFKIRLNNGWDHSMGGSMDRLVYGTAPNVPGPAAGTYTATLDLSTWPYSITFQ